MAVRTGRLVAFFRRAEPRGAPPSGWALALDAAVAVGAAGGAVYEMATRDLVQRVPLPGPLIPQAVEQAINRAGIAIPEALRQAIQQAAQAGQQAGGQAQVTVGVAPVHVSLLLLAGAALTGLPLAWRRLYPVTAWLVVIAAIVAVHNSYVPPVALGTAVYAAYSSMVHSRYRNLAIAVVSLSTVFAALWVGNDLPRFPGRLTAVFAILPAAVAGVGIRELRRRLADSTARLRRAADEARLAMERALAAERARIAAELHDVVTHNVSVMIVQAGAARKIMATSPADAEDALLAVESTGREAMTELRTLLGLLSPAADGSDGGAAHRAAVPPASAADGMAGPAGSEPAGAAGTGGGDGTAAALRPQPGLSELDALIERVTATGLPVALTVSGSPRPLSPGADLAAYRVVQEGLTNVLRHAGQTTASVTVRWDDELEITVSDDGQAPGCGAAGDGGGAGDGGMGAAHGVSGLPSHGRGLLGLRERLALYGGQLAAGPRPEGGWRLRAVLPPALGVPGQGGPPPETR